MLDIVLGYALDLVAGDPYWFPHPVRLIGRFISFMERMLRGIARAPAAQKAAGVALAVITVSITYAVLYFMLKYARQWNEAAYHALNIFFICMALATHSLSYEALKIYRLLENGNIEGARHALSFIVGRDTECLDTHQISRAVVETVAENASDGVVAPLFYLFIGGVPLAMAYKAVNTLDSMVGYKNERYRYFGWASARLDDVANFLPARITGLLIALVAVVCRGSSKRALMTMVREGSHHESPNSGYPEAAMAGALSITLGGPSTYGGKLVDKPVLGQALRPIEPSHIFEAVRIMKIASLLALIIGVLVLWAI
ncbi:adenosylcobinamide-phosphate synthase CbiB [Mahella australiensis]|uniref:Cobalamin biosynthesis protein CobD n=1 Tax=Mahella australiensis (strain DSM 15567 / CIP 107919 / 50-1 BON) TaxID=697281 RepID=F4A153_MAHA5|nr:adenosylcobinamide-phosphate synthase CbiB [Mahella australiensis]AEE95956.1 cobalamin biosynthesis protein CobD [Mahella australiensis 50-1 BON]